jgi:hypothetical protein
MEFMDVLEELDASFFSVTLPLKEQTASLSEIVVIFTIMKCCHTQKIITNKDSGLSVNFLLVLNKQQINFCVLEEYPKSLKIPVSIINNLLLHRFEHLGYYVLLLFPWTKDLLSTMF